LSTWPEVLIVAKKYRSVFSQVAPFDSSGKVVGPIRNHVAISAHGQRGVIAESVPNRTLGIVPRPVCPSSRGDPGPHLRKPALPCLRPQPRDRRHHPLEHHLPRPRRSLSFAPRPKLRPISCSPTLPRSAGSTSSSMATTSGHPNRSRRGFGRCEIRAPPSSMPLSVRFGTDSAMTPFGLR
jgi:hypothetical protein